MMNGAVSFHVLEAPVKMYVAFIFSYRDESQRGGHLRVGHPQHTVNRTAACYPYHS